MSDKRTDLINALRAAGVTSSPVRRQDIANANVSLGKSASVPAWILGDDSRRAGRGLFHLPEVVGATHATPAPAPRPAPAPVAAPAPRLAPAAPSLPTADAVLALTAGESDSLVPQKISTYIPFGHYADLERIVQSGMFYPAFVTGLSGNGKTTMIDQICAKLGRELFRVNITALTDEDDLLGGMRLIDGDMAWVDGPVVAAMKRGAVLLLDEIDLASHAIMCLQPVLEGKGVFLKKTGQWVRPAAGFQVFATANTKGQGDDTGKFVATNVLNEAFLDRFPVCVEQEYPDKATEKKIVTKVMEGLGCLDRDFAKRLVDWADTIRTCYREGGVDEIVTTRRVVNICTAFAVFGDRMKAIRMGVTRFDASTQEAFITMYEKIDATATPEEDTE